MTRLAVAWGSPARWGSTRAGLDWQADFWCIVLPEVMLCSAGSSIEVVEPATLLACRAITSILLFVVSVDHATSLNPFRPSQ